MSASSSVLMGRQPLGVTAVVYDGEMQRAGPSEDLLCRGLMAMTVSLLVGSPVLIVPSRTLLPAVCAFANVRPADAVLSHN